MKGKRRDISKMQLLWNRIKDSTGGGWMPCVLSRVYEGSFMSMAMKQEVNCPKCNAEIQISGRYEMAYDVKDRGFVPRTEMEFQLCESLDRAEKCIAKFFRASNPEQISEAIIEFEIYLLKSGLLPNVKNDSKTN